MLKYVQDIDAAFLTIGNHYEVIFASRGDFYIRFGR